MEQVTDMLQRRFPDPRAAIEYALNYFTAVDLQGIRDNLRKGD
jgi:hypothetical protein